MGSLRSANDTLSHLGDVDKVGCEYLKKSARVCNRLSELGAPVSVFPSLSTFVEPAFLKPALIPPSPCSNFISSSSGRSKVSSPIAKMGSGSTPWFLRSIQRRERGGSTREVKGKHTEEAKVRAGLEEGVDGFLLTRLHLFIVHHEQRVCRRIVGEGDDGVGRAFCFNSRHVAAAVVWGEKCERKRVGSPEARAN